ncbi:glycine betaine ABC transporter substrate-binding protein [Prauserella muralis]|uniref:Glycine/betaine ABC transporter substrate-binding protein n=1 Tax=Prauserella muralis TaxID=588067 RepID=A0A2V4ATT8_9PSEU|nr:glycine betaine ABC transporter substrate-binding protein [Prauserella muralis]PXY24662.1 glycine/betaine ABC transporter substrate-binding protein [Prauserella muralis]TWE27648.1 osmoprotectant transport system substrate-binding protein [Prauserella muralis]
MSMRTVLTLAVAGAAAIGLAGCGGDASGGEGPLAGTSFVVGAKDFSEQDILAAMTAQLLEARGADAEPKRITGSVNTRKALESGEVDLYWEYTGTGWITYLGNTTPISDPAEQYEAVKRNDAAENGIAWLEPAGFNNTYALAVRTGFAEQHGLKTLSDVAELARSQPQAVTICVESEFAARDDGLSGLLRTYGIDVPRQQIKTLDTGVIYAETGKGDACNFGEVFATDGRIANLGLTVLDDDKRFFPVYQGAPTLKQQTLQQHPEIADILGPLAERLDTTTMQQLNAQVDVEGLDAEDVAQRWLQEEGLL